MPELNKHEIRSTEMQEVMSEIPGSFLKWGLFLFFAIVLSIVGVSWFINYPDIVTVPVTITTFNSPASLVTRTGGKIEILFVNNGEKVTENQPVAIIDNQAEWDDILAISSFIKSFIESTGWDTVVIGLKYPVNLILGEVQSSWIRFLNLLIKYKEYIDQAYMPTKVELLEKQINRQEEYISELENQQNLSEEDLQLAFNSFHRDSLLFHRSNFTISINEFEQSRQALLQKRISFSSLKSSVKNAESSSLKMKESLLDLKIQYEKEINQYNADINEALQLLKVALGKWEEKYLVRSPVNGTITFTSFWNENQNINPGEVLATVIPENPSRIIVRAEVPSAGSGKVRQGQEVNIKLSGYPYMEFGVIKGRISSVSLVSVEDAYIAEIELVNGMRTTYGREPGFINYMTGTADIITDNSRLIYRFIKPLKNLVKK
ncbi:MAG: HlyD family efflux transporter periplasmic adaptor subunit [Bacteroidota bacterium]